MNITQLTGYVMDRTESGEKTTVRDICRHFEATCLEVESALTALKSDWCYTVSTSQRKIEGKTIVSISFNTSEEKPMKEVITADNAEQLVGVEGTVEQYVDGVAATPEASEAVVAEVTTPAKAPRKGRKAKTTEQVQEEANAASDDGVETTEADQPVVTGARSANRFKPGVYVDYTKEDAISTYGEDGYISIADLHKRFVQEDIPTSRMVKAFGGDQGKTPTLNDNWKPFTIGGSPKRYLSIKVLEDLELMRDKATWAAAWKPAAPEVVEIVPPTEA